MDVGTGYGISRPAPNLFLLCRWIGWLSNLSGASKEFSVFQHLCVKRLVGQWAAPFSFLWPWVHSLPFLTAPLRNSSASTLPQADWYKSGQTTQVRGEFEILSGADHGIKVAVQLRSILE
ncbi:hypothetical protein DFH07DRAFT_766126 [Mycena maculata]|uniref:Uncharacterized protein n=1 Tax=Mycena maculata TaxID=230809 RepID=A0AAD7K619_9AGAR|nr:hypothetical protein DFH07DRAFT_766126 [Mycena maculata]